ncbi:hypothetical protein [Moorena producens]|uniref:hypothetical protein n=1 Tax=Moorena producens TaxID=1155739 RepID=UPI000A8544CD|nr:hypothetical protein [Moorena producens]
MIISDSLFPTPCSLLPAPCSLFPIPCSLFPIPYSLFPLLSFFVIIFTGTKSMKIRSYLCIIFGQTHRIFC